MTVCKVLIDSESVIETDDPDLALVVFATQLEKLSKIYEVQGSFTRQVEIQAEGNFLRVTYESGSLSDAE